MTAREFAAHIYDASDVTVHVVDEREGVTFSTWAGWLAASEMRSERNVKWWKYECGEFTVVLD